LLLSAVQAGDIDRQQRAPSSNGATARRSAANAGSVVHVDSRVDEAEHRLVITPPPIGERSIAMSESVCLSVSVFVCPRSYLPNYATDLHQVFVQVTYGRGSVLIRWRSDTLRISGFIDDVIFAHKPRLLDVAAQLKRSAHAALGLTINCA